MKMNKILLTALLASIFTFEAYADESKKLSRDDCAINIEHPVFDTVDHSCDLFSYQRKGSNVTYMVLVSESHVAFASYHQGGPGLFYPFSGDVKRDTENYLKSFPYIDDNWERIYNLSRKNKTAYTASNEKVVLSKVDLRQQTGCIGFSKGMGARQPIQGGTGSNQMINLLLCDLKNADLEEDLIEIIETISFTPVR